MSETKNIQIIFERDGFRDALYFPYDDYLSGKITPEQEETLKQERYDNFVYTKEHPPVQVEPTPEEIQAQIDQMTAMVEQFQAQIPELVNLRSVRIEEIAIAEQLALEESLIDAPVELGVRR